MLTQMSKYSVFPITHLSANITFIGWNRWNWLSFEELFLRFVKMNIIDMLY